MKKTTKRFVVIGLIMSAILITYFSLPRYAQRALIYQKVGIDDYPIFSNREVANADAQEWPVDNKLAGYQLDADDALGFQELNTIAYLVIKDGKVIFEQYWDGYNTESKTNSFSMAKSIISFLIGAAIDEGYIKSLNQPVSDFIPAFDTESNRELTIRQVLTMSSGLNWDESYGSLFNTTTEAYYGTNLKQLIYSLQVVDKPGFEFKYLSGNTQLLAMVLEQATGKNVASYASEKFWKPMGAVNTALWSLDHDGGIEKAYCCFNSNARDFARWGQLVLNKGTWNGDTLLSAEYVRQATEPASYLIDESGNPIDYYGFQWWIQNMDGNKIPYMRGILGQYVFVLPHENAVVVRLGHKRSEERQNHHPLDTYLYLATAQKILKAYNE